MPLAIALPVGLLDRATKVWAEHALAGQPPRGVIPGLLRLELAVNPGTAFGLLGSGVGISRAIPVLLSLLLLLYLGWLGLRPRPAGRLRNAGLGLMLGGTAANLVDRAFGRVPPPGLWDGWWDGRPRAGVVDFVVIEPWPGRPWPAFNLADAALVVGAGLLLASLWRAYGAPPAPTPAPPAVRS